MTSTRLLSVLIVILLGCQPAIARQLAPDVVVRFDANARQCGGEWTEVSGSDREGVHQTPAIYVPALSALNGPAELLSNDQAIGIYAFAHGMLRAAFAGKVEGVPDWLAHVKCVADPAIALSVLKWLVGDQAADRRGPLSSYNWIGAAYRDGIGVSQDKALAHRWFLKARISFGWPDWVQWSDGIDNDPYQNVVRAGLLAFMMQTASEDSYYGAARRILADHVVKTDPEQARSLLHIVHNVSVERLHELEDEGLLKPIYSVDELGFWSKVAAAMPRDERSVAKARVIAEHLNGGKIPVSDFRPTVQQALGDIDLKTELGKKVTANDILPTPLRALVDKDGKALWVEPCILPKWENGIQPDIWHENTYEALRLFAAARLKNLTPAIGNGKAAYSWVILPAMQIVSDKVFVEKARVRFLDVRSPICQQTDEAGRKASSNQ